MAVAGCTGGADVDMRSHTVTDSAGILIVQSNTPEWTTPRVIEPDPVLRIGQEGEGPYLFEAPSALFLGGGDIAVAEAGAGEVRIFDADGGLRRKTIFDRESGEFRIIDNSVEGNQIVFGRTRDGPFLLYSPFGYQPDLPPGLQWVESDVVAVDPDRSHRVIARLPQPQEKVEPDGNTSVVLPQMWSIQAVTHDGFYWATSDRYEIAFRDAEGTLRRILRRPIEPRPVQQEDIDAYIDTILATIRRFEGEASAQMQRASYEEAEFGEHVPFFGVAFVDKDQRLWVSESTWPSLGGLPRQWSVFSAEGIWLGDLEAPERFRIMDARGDLVLGVWKDELDVPYVHVYRIAEG